MAKLLLLLLLVAACARPDGERVLGERATPTLPEAVLGAAAVVVPQPPQPTLPTPTARSTGASTAPDGVAQAAVEGIAAEASGVGEIAVGRFADNPVGPIGFATAGFFTLSVAPGSAFGLVTVMRCQVGGGLVYWWDGAAWRLASQQAFDRDTGCVTVAVTGTSIPSLAQVAGPGVAFALGEPPLGVAVDPADG